MPLVENIGSNYNKPLEGQERQVNPNNKVGLVFYDF